jgi:hypothetical protein
VKGYLQDWDEECTIDVGLEDLEVIVGAYREEGFDTAEVCYGCSRIGIVATCDLAESLGHNSALVAERVPFVVSLDLDGLLLWDHFSLGGADDELKCVVVF